MKIQNSYDIVIAGAGPCGLLAALLLKQADLSVALFEKEPRPTAHSYALALHQQTQILLDKLNLLDTVRQHALPVSEMRAYGDAGVVQGELPFSYLDKLYPSVLVIPQSTLEVLLVNALKAAGVEVHWNHRVARFNEIGGSVDIEVDELDIHGTGYAVAHSERFVKHVHQLSASYLIGADGHHSLVRRQLMIPFVEMAPPLHFAVYEFTTKVPAEPRMLLYMDANSVNCFWPMPHDHARWAFQIETVETPPHSRDKEHSRLHVAHEEVPLLTRANLDKLTAERAPGFEPNVHTLKWSMAVRFENRLAESFGKGRIWLTGDAGHLTGPAGMQGMNIGLLETADLARSIVAKILGVAYEGRHVDSLDHYNHERLAVWRALLDPKHQPEPSSNSSDWVRNNTARLRSSIPASGDNLAEALVQL